jgi:hypothetical protein
MLSSSLDAEIEIWYDLCFNFINVRLEGEVHITEVVQPVTHIMISIVT